MNMNKLKLIIASAYAALVSVLFVVIITIISELVPSLKDWLKNLFGHHWVSKSILSVLLYLIVAKILYFSVCNNNNGQRVRKSLKLLLIFVVLGVVAISLFYIGHYFHIF